MCLLNTAALRVTKEFLNPQIFITLLSHKILSFTTGTTLEAQLILPHQDTAYCPITRVGIASRVSMILLPCKIHTSDGPSFLLNTFL